MLDMQKSALMRRREDRALRDANWCKTLGQESGRSALLFPFRKLALLTGCPVPARQARRVLI